jgi:predicted O-methyltransferase YrrM
MQQLPAVKTVVEVGFNGGHSAAAFLSARPDVKVISFDLGFHNYVLSAKRLIDRLYPERHLLIIGDSTKTVPLSTALFRLGVTTADLAYIDGGHGDLVPYQDITNFLKILPSGAHIIVDDYCQTYGIYGVIQGWERALAERLVTLADGPFTVRDRGWIVGRKL